MIKLKELISSKKRWSAVVIDDASRELLLSTYKSEIPEGWEIIAHHMTIDFRNISNDEGRTVTLKVVGVGKDNKALAVKVDGYPSSNKIPHITIAINRKDGASPKNSNDIITWETVESGISLNGTVQNL